jgi:XTP/dITP diphosphohydrolase
MDIVLATKNIGKIKEICQIFQGTKYRILSLEDVGIDVDVIEDTNSFEQNAIKKATEIMNICKMPTMADDSGLVIDALSDILGVDSANFMGKDAPYNIRCNAILEMLENLPFSERTARFVCYIALVFPSTQTFTVNGKVEGIIAEKAQGENGFGYDPIFYLPEFSKTMAQLSVDEKNQISHRSNALKATINLLKEVGEGR